jgi:hypothetical protein
MSKAEASYYPRNGITFVLAFFIFFIFGFIFVGIDNSTTKSLKLEDIFYSLLSSLLMVLIPSIASFRKIIILDKDHFVLRILFFKKEYSHSDLQEVYFNKRMGTKDYFAIIMNDGKKMGISKVFWSASYYNDLKEYFTKYNTEKINDRTTM